MLKSLSLPVKYLGGIIIFVFFITVIVISISGNRRSKKEVPHYLHDNASEDNKVEALKTLTAHLASVQENNKKLEKAIESIRLENKTSIHTLRNRLSMQLKDTLSDLRSKQKNVSLGEKPLDTLESSINNKPVHHFIWLTDLSTMKSSDFTKFNKRTTSKKPWDSILNDDRLDGRSSKKNNKKHLYYTIPENATLSNATLMTPLVGRVPIDGKLSSPYFFKLVLSGRNLTANDYPLPEIRGAVMSGVASGDMLGSCVRGSIRSMTFIFKDGRINTVHAKGENERLGYLSTETGNPCIPGTFHSNATVFLGAKTGMAGLQAYANALSNSQNRGAQNNNSFSELIDATSRAALGHGMSASAEAAQTWWNQRVRNAFDYVYVPNLNPNTHQAMKVVVNITRQIAIDDNTNNRKVDYEHALPTITDDLD